MLARRVDRTRWAAIWGHRVKVRMIGAHNFASRSTRLGCAIVDGRLALDAGSLSGGLTLDE